MPVEKHDQNTNGLPYLFSPSTDANKSAPLVLFLHGARDRGNDLNVLLKWGLPRFVDASNSLPYFFAAPQLLFVFHVNSTKDALIRAERHPPIREIEPNYFLERDGQTMHFFSKEYLLDLLSDWKHVELKHYEILDEQTDKPFKRVWWGKAIQPD